MTDPKQIPHLVKLLDDESHQVRMTVARELAAFGPTLQNKLKKLTTPLNDKQKVYISKIMEGHKRIWLRRTWPAWLRKSVKRKGGAPDYKEMESALSILSEFLNHHVDYKLNLGWLLDELAAEYKVRFKEVNARTLAKFLFKQKALRGDENDYYNVQNSNLVYVIKEKKGIPISLTTVYMLVGMRVGLKIEGCHFPGHFLARINLGGKKVFVDCFNGGHIIGEKDLLSIKKEAFKGLEKVLHEKTNVQMIVRAFFANLIRSYQITEDQENHDLLIKLFSDMDIHQHGKKADDLTPEDIINSDNPAFKPGECVYHRRYGYRGIIVDVDTDCMATDDWYYSNQTQPSRYQPWYHVLVHGSDQVTYVAENNLDKDQSNKSVTHPLLSYFFTKTKEGAYIRNENTWPETDF